MYEQILAATTGFKDVYNEFLQECKNQRALMEQAIKEIDAALAPIATAMQAHVNDKEEIPSELLNAYHALIRRNTTARPLVEFYAQHVFLDDFMSDISRLITMLEELKTKTATAEAVPADELPVATPVPMPVVAPPEPPQPEPEPAPAPAAPPEPPKFSVKRSIEEIKSVIGGPAFEGFSKYEKVAVLCGMLFGTEWFDPTDCRKGVEVTLGLEGQFNTSTILSYCSVEMDRDKLILRSELKSDARTPAVRGSTKYRYQVSEVTVSMIKRLFPENS